MLCASAHHLYTTCFIILYSHTKFFKRKFFTIWAHYNSDFDQCMEVFKLPIVTLNHASVSLRHDGNSILKFLYPIWNFVKTWSLRLQIDERKVFVGLFWNFSHALFVSWVNLHTFKHDRGVILWCWGNYSWEKFNFCHWERCVFGDHPGEIIRIFF